MLAGAVLDDNVARNVAQISTGAWYDYSAPNVADCVHGNPNVLAPDVGTSRLAQGSTGQLVRVEIVAYGGVPPSVSVHDHTSWIHG